MYVSVPFPPLVDSICHSILQGADIDMQGLWKATGSESGTKFADIDLTEGDWYEYDEKASDEVSIKDVKWEIRRA